MAQNYVSASGILSTDSQYVIRLTITDYFGTASAEFNIATAFVLIDFNQTGRGIAFGKVSEMAAFECALDIYDKNKRPVEGTDDTGWINLTLNSGWSYQYESDRPQYRRIGKQVFLRGLIDGTAAAGTIIATLPTGFRPSMSFNRFTCALNQTEFVNIQVNSSGINDYTKAGKSRTFICLAGISFLV